MTSAGAAGPSVRVQPPLRMRIIGYAQSTGCSLGPSSLSTLIKEPRCHPETVYQCWSGPGWEFSRWALLPFARRVPGRIG